MNINKNWSRWIFASLSKHFADAYAAAGIPLFIEGQHRNTRLLANFFELRVDGPTLREVSKGCWIFRVEVNILVQSAMNDTNYHVVHQNVGIAASAFEKGIPVFKKGSGADDDQSFVGCLQLLQNERSRDFVEINHFGQIDVKTKLMQATVEGHYEMTLQTS
jgi:hypothetical protein